MFLVAARCIDVCDERESTPKFRECIELLELAHACLIDALSRVDAVLQNPSPEVVLFHDALSLIECREIKLQGQGFAKSITAPARKSSIQKLFPISFLPLLVGLTQCPLIREHNANVMLAHHRPKETH